MKGQLYLVTSLMVLGFTAMGFGLFQQPWPVPDKNVKMANPVKSDAESLKTGKEVWSKHCQSCHGKSGLGDGTKAAQLKTEVASFTDPKIQGETDGSLFYKTSEGRDDMPAFKKKIPDQEELWSVINYIRTFKK
jgi:mono/diheme cytochrome c family protein